MRIPGVRIASYALFFGVAPLSAQVPAPRPELHRTISEISVRGPTTLRLPAAPSLATAQDSSIGTGVLIFGGIIGGGLGMVIGAAAGAGLEVLLSADCYDFCGLGGGFVGAGVGESLGMAFGVHTANDQRGSFGAAVVGPLGVFLTSVAVIAVLDDVSVPPILAVGIPVLQLATSIRGERGAEKRKRDAPN